MTLIRGPSAGHGPNEAKGLQEDAALVALVAQRDGAALEVIYNRYSRACYALSRRIVNDDRLAQDVVQNVFMALWAGAGRYDADRGGFSTWLLALTHHKAVDLVRREENLRKRRTTADALEGRESDQPQVHEQAWSAMRGERVRTALQTLPPAQREALSLAYFGGYTQREIAGLTSTPLGTVKTRMLTGMRRLRDQLGGLNDGAPDEPEFGDAL